MKYAIPNTKNTAGSLSFRLRREEKWSPKSVEDMLAVDLEGPEYEPYDAKIPLAEMGDTFLSFYEDMAEEKGNEIIGKDKRGLRPGDWVLLHMFDRPHQAEEHRHLLITSWMHNGPLENHVDVLMWNEGNANAFYLVKEGYPDPRLKGKLNKGTNNKQ